MLALSFVLLAGKRVPLLDWLPLMRQQEVAELLEFTIAECREAVRIEVRLLL